MNKAYFVVLIFCVVQLLSCSLAIKNYNPNKKYPKQKLQQDYILLKNILEKKHSSLYWYTSKDSMDMYFKTYYAAIEDSMTEQQFGWKIIAPLTEKIHCGHTSFGMSKTYNKWVKNKVYPTFPLFLKIWNDTMIVTTNLNPKDSILKRGTLITGINGLKNNQLTQTLFGYMVKDGYFESVNFQRLSNNFPYYHRNIFGLTKNYTVNYLDKNNIEKTTTVPLLSPLKDSSKKITRLPIVKKSKKQLRQQQLLNIRSVKIDSTNNTALITLNTFTTNKLRKFFRQTFRFIKKANIANVILDIRSNGGGRVNNSTLLTKYVTHHPFKIADTAYTASKYLQPYSRYIKGKNLNNIELFFITHKKQDGYFHFGYLERKKYYPKHKNHFDGRLYVLISGQTFSASTLFCNIIKKQPGITLIGEEAGGGWYGNNGMMIPDITLPNTHLRVRLPLFKLIQFNHVPKDGHGVMPDVYVGPSYDALLKGYDKKMLVAMDLIMGKK